MDFDLDAIIDAVTSTRQKQPPKRGQAILKTIDHVGLYVVLANTYIYKGRRITRWMPFEYGGHVIEIIDPEPGVNTLKIRFPGSTDEYKFSGRTKRWRKSRLPPTKEEALSVRRSLSKEEKEFYAKSPIEILELLRSIHISQLRMMDLRRELLSGEVLKYLDSRGFVFLAEPSGSRAGFDLDAIIAAVTGQRDKQPPQQRRKPVAQTIDLDAIIARVAPQADPQMARVGVLQRLALSRAEYFGPTTLRGMDLFAGAGGFTIGALASSCPVIGVEYSKRAVETGRAAGHDVLRMDVREVANRGARTALRMDVMLGGPPCQPFSSAGKRRGKYDPREGFGLALDAIDAWHPRRVVLENVSAFLSSDHRSYREQILAALRERFAHVGYWLLDARDYGVPQDRERVFLWAAEAPLVPPPATHGPGTGKSYVTARQALPHLLDEGLNYLMAFQGGATSRSTDRPSPTITTVRNLYAVTEGGLTYRGASSVPQHKRRILYPREIQALQAFPPTFGFLGTLKERASQIGNAVPPPLAAAVMGAVTAGLSPRSITPTELLDSFKQIDETIWVLEPRPWTDAALIGITTNAPGAPGALVPVYDGFEIKHAVLTASLQQTAAQHRVSIQQLPSALRQQAEYRALDYLSADKQSHYNPAAPIVVPTQTLRTLRLPIATMLLSDAEREAALEQAAISLIERQEARRIPAAQRQDRSWDVLNEVLAQHGEIMEF